MLTRTGRITGGTAIFSLMHLRFASHILDGLSPEAALGSVYPDTGVVAGSSWEETHLDTADLYRRATKLPPGAERKRMVTLARACLTHGADPPGLDFYGDQSYPGGERGFSFQLARPYADRAADICRLPRDMGWWKAHNFVEMAAEVIVHRWDPTLGAYLAEQLEDRRLTQEVAAFVGGTGDTFRAMPPYLTLRDVTAESLAFRYQRQVRTRHGVEAIDVSAAAGLIEELTPEVEAALPGFLRYVEPRVAAVMRRFPG